jgi:hypothetical protein
MMDRQNSVRYTLLALTALLLLISCARPDSDPEKLKAIGTEAQSLLIHYPLKYPRGWVDVPKDRWPPSITALNPEWVKVAEWGVDILIKADFDGGYGYHIPRQGHRLPMPPRCYSEQSKSVFWHDPC